ncbi:MAG TPA: TonB-dependent receptor [Terriglobales bacterium]|nr:TonB-dependent receptor [Terriglobales bacterium]
MALNLGCPKVLLTSVPMGVLAFFCVLAPAQTTVSTGSIQGTVTDLTGAVVPGAKVSITNKSTKRVIQVATTTTGTYASGALMPGNYTVRIEAKGFKTSELPLTIEVGVTASGNIKLQAGEATQVIYASAMTLNIEQASLQGVMNRPLIENLSIDGRNFLDLAQLEPGVQMQDGVNFGPTKIGLSSASIGGRSGRTTRVEVEGLNLSDEKVGATVANVPLGAIEEFQIQQSSLDLSTEMTSSSSVNVAIKSGTNGYHGEGYYDFRDQTFNADLPGASDHYFQRNQFGGNFGGAFIQDKLFFFVDAERTKQDLVNPVLPGGPFQLLTGTYDSPFRESQGVVRLDWLINNEYKTFYRFSYDQSRDVLGVLPNVFQPLANVNHTPSYALGLDFNRGSYTHSLRFGYTKYRNSVADAALGTGVANPLPDIELAIGSDPLCLTPGVDVFCSGPSYLAPQQTYQSADQITYDGSRVIEKHILRFGGGFTYLWGGGFASFLKLAPAVGANLTACGAPCRALSGGVGNPVNYPAQSVVFSNGVGFDTEKPRFGLPEGGIGPDYRTSVYLGDAWQASPNLTLTYGLRYVRDSFRSDADLGPVPFLNQWQAGLGRRINQPNLNFAPQAGIAWDPTRQGRTVFRGGIGLFYENSVWNNSAYDRPGRLETGLFRQNPVVCSNGLPVPLTLPNGPTVMPGFCGEPIGQAAPAIAALQAQYQAATAALGFAAPNPGYIGTTRAAGIDVNGITMLAPNYVTPRSVEMNLGLQHMFGKSSVFKMDFLRNIETHTLLAEDVNHVGDAEYFNVANAQAAISATTAAFGCTGGFSGTAINCAIAAGAHISDFAAHGLDSGYSVCGGRPCPTAAFPGINPSLGANQMLFPIGRSEYNGLQLSLRQGLQTPFKNVKSLNLQASYTFSKYIATATDTDLFAIATDFDNPLRFIGPNGLDRKQQIAFGGWLDLPYSFNLGVIGHFYSPLPVTLELPPSGLPGGIFVTDVTGDGTGDGSFASSGGRGDVFPGTNLGSFARGVTPGNLNDVIRNYNQNFAGRPTPAGQMLLNDGVLTPGQLLLLGGVLPLIPAAPSHQANMAWLKAFDLSLNWKYKFKDRVEIQPGVALFNVMNLANFDGPTNPLNGQLSGNLGAVNGTPGEPPNLNRIGTGSGAFALGSPRMIDFGLKVRF